MGNKKQEFLIKTKHEATLIVFTDISWSDVSFNSNY